MDSHGRLLTASLNLGQPTVLAHPRSEFARTIQTIAESVRGACERPTAAVPAAPARPGILPRPALLSRA
jgi:hypothetical protein